MKCGNPIEFSGSFCCTFAWPGGEEREWAGPFRNLVFFPLNAPRSREAWVGRGGVINRFKERSRSLPAHASPLAHWLQTGMVDNEIATRHRPFLWVVGVSYTRPRPRCLPLTRLDLTHWVWREL